MSGAGKVVVTAGDAELAREIVSWVRGHAVTFQKPLEHSASVIAARHRIAAEAAQLEALREAREALGWAATRLAAWAATSLADGKPTAAAKIKEWEREARQALASLTAAIEKVTP